MDVMASIPLCVLLLSHAPHRVGEMQKYGPAGWKSGKAGVDLRKVRKQASRMSGDNKKRPVNLDLRTIRLPVGGVVSILHRITGVILVFSIPVMLYALQESLASANAFTRFIDGFKAWPARLGFFVFVLILAHHFLAGLRHLLLDLDIGISRRAARRGAWWVLAGVTAVAVLGGGRLFL